MPKKTWIAAVGDHAIRVENSWTGGAKLYVDGECRDTFNSLTATSDRPALTARLTANDPSSPLVEVYLKTLFTVRAKICIDGKQVSGDAF